MNTDLELSRVLDSAVLGQGKHETRDEGMCAMELTAFLAGERHTDQPACACPALTAYTIGLNDPMPEVWRQQLKPYLPLLIGSRDGREVERAELLARRACTVFAPVALDAAGLGEHAARLRGMTGATMAELRAAASTASANAAYAASAYAAYASAACAAAASWDTVGPLALQALDDAIAIGREDRPAPAPEIARLIERVP